MPEVTVAYSRLSIILALLVGSFGVNYFTSRRLWLGIALAGFLGSSLLVLHSPNWYIFILGWEGTTIALLALLFPGSSSMALLYGVVHISGATLLLIGLAVIASQQGLDEVLGGNVWPFSTWLVMGFVIKAGALGVHQWLPVVHAEARAPVSALLSGFGVVLGVWGLLHVISTPSHIVAVWGLLTALYGGWRAIWQQDLKRLLAYSTVSHVGLMILGVGIATEAARAAVVVHAFGHGLFKSLMFLVAGYWEKTLGTRNIYRLADGEYRSGWVLIAQIVGVLGLVGVPWFAGYPGKHLLQATLAGTTWAYAGISLVSILSVACGSKILLPFFMQARWPRHFLGRIRWFRPGSLELGLLLSAIITMAFGLWPEWFVGSLPGVSIGNSGKLVSTPVSILIGGVVGYLVTFWGLNGQQPGSLLSVDRMGEIVTEKVVLGGSRLLSIARDLHNGDIGRYLQWFLLGAVVILIMLKMNI